MLIAMSKIDDLIGQISDSEIARLMRISIYAVAKRRIELGIAEPISPRKSVRFVSPVTETNNAPRAGGYVTPMCLEGKSVTSDNFCRTTVPVGCCGPRPGYRRDCVLYFIEAVRGGGVVKIGITSEDQTRERLSSLQKGCDTLSPWLFCPFELEYIGLTRVRVQRS
jgi:hypothetical protein